MTSGGLPPSDPDLREVMLPLLEDLPDNEVLEMGSGLRTVVEEAERHAARLARPDSDETTTPQRKPSATLLAARKLLEGRTVVLMGGLPRPLQQRRLEEALGLAELRWIAVQHHQSLEDELLHQVRRPEVSVIMVLTRWRSHAFGPQVRQWCKQLGKVFVELPAGYGAEQVAHQVMTQAESGLTATASAAQAS